MRRLALVAAAAALLSAGATLPQPAAACPPGLAKKNPPCVPPGQAKKGVTTEEWQRSRGDDDRYDDDRWEREPTRAERYDELIREYGDLMSEVELVVLRDGTVLRPGDRLPRGYRALSRSDYPYLPPLPRNREYYEVGGQVVEVIDATNTLVRTWKLLTD